MSAPAGAVAPRATTPLGAHAAAVWADWRAREPRLVTFAVACLALGGVTGVAAAVDPRTLLGVSVWMKPAKFFVSTAVFALTWVWGAGMVRADRRGARGLRGAERALLTAAGFELAYITWQAALGEASHYNVGDPVHAILYALMGVGAVVLIGSVVPLAWALVRDPAPDADPVLQRSAALGFVLTVLVGGVLGGYMSAQSGHAVGAETAHATVTGWNRSGGDLRVAHFLGLHAAQAVPLAAWGLAAAGVRGPWRERLVWLAAAVWAGLAVAVFAQALGGRPFPLG